MWFLRYASGQTHTDRQTDRQADRYTNMLIATLYRPPGDEVTSCLNDR